MFEKSKYDQEIPQSQTADKSIAPRRMISMLYSTFFIMFDYLFKLVTQTRLPNNFIEFINCITIKYEERGGSVVECLIRD